ncbi:MAG: response regulator [Nitrospinae bacterium]|nr:response regulator [Nitrospinota bacterium]
MVESGAGGHGKILIVDDSEDICLLLTGALTRNGYSVISAGNGDEGARTYFENPDVRLVITDMDMPVLNGLGLIKNSATPRPRFRFWC